MKSNSIDNSNDEQILIWQQAKLMVSIGEKKEMLNYQKNQAIHFDNYGQSKKDVLFYTWIIDEFNEESCR